MEKIMPGHLVGFGSVRDMDYLEANYHGEFTDAGMTVDQRSVSEDMPSKDEFDKLCAQLAGEVITYKIKP